MDSKPDPLVVIVGETASGKSDLSMKLAELFDGEIICADATTVRRCADIGTAKPTLTERTRIKHHLLDVVGPCDDFTAAVFKDMAKRSIDEIFSRGKLPIMVGGSGLYIDSVLYDYSFLPAGDRSARKSLEAMSIDELLNQIHSKGLDTDNIDTRNKRRLMRLLETEGARPTKHAVRQNTLILGIRIPSDQLKQRVIVRIDKMLAQGLEQEVRKLYENYSWQCEALKAIGYREWLDYFEGSQTLEQTRHRIAQATLNVLAKKQRTWFKRNKSIRWVNNTSEAVNFVSKFLDKKPNC